MNLNIIKSYWIYFSLIAVMNHTFEHNASATLEQATVAATTSMLTSSTLTALTKLSVPVIVPKRKQAVPIAETKLEETRFNGIYF